MGAGMSDLKQLWARATQKGWDNGWISGRLGRLNGDGSYTIPVSDKAGWVHVRLGVNGDQGNTIARNLGVPHHRNMPIRMRRENGVLAVHGRDILSGFQGSDNGSANVGPHASTHDRLGPDPLYIRGLAFLPLAARPTSTPSMAVTVERAFYRYGGEIKVWETGDSSSLSAYVPVAPGVQHFVLISLNRSTNALAITDGFDVASNASAPPFTAETVETIVETLSDAHRPIAAIRLYNGQTVIRSADIFMDLRFWGGDDVASSIDINALTEDTAPDGSADYLATYDASAAGNRKVLLDNMPGGTGNVSLLYSQTIDKTVADTTDETSLLSAGRGSKTLPADLLEQGTTIRIALSGHISDTGNPTMDIKASLGGTEVCSTGAENLGTSVSQVDFHLLIYITCRTTGASGTVVASGLFEHDDGTSFGLVKTTATTIDTTGALAIDVTATWGTQSASNTITCQEVTIERLAVDALAPVGPTGLTATETV